MPANLLKRLFSALLILVASLASLATSPKRLPVFSVASPSAASSVALSPSTPEVKRQITFRYTPGHLSNAVIEGLYPAYFQLKIPLDDPSLTTKVEAKLLFPDGTVSILSEVPPSASGLTELSTNRSLFLACQDREVPCEETLTLVFALKDTSVSTLTIPFSVDATLTSTEPPKPRKVEAAQRAVTITVE